MRYLFAYFIFIRKLRCFDFIYIYYPSSFKHITLLCKLFGVRYGLYIRGQQKLDDRLSHWIYRNAYTIMTVSDFFTQKVNKIVRRNVAATIRPMIPQTYDDIVHDRTYHAKETYSILFLGRIDAAKGLKELMLAVNELRQTYCRFTLNIVGNGDYISVLKELSIEYQLNDVVRIKGPVFGMEEKKTEYSNADIYIIPSHHEGFPRTLYEAMIYGTPVITTMVGGIPALMKHKVNCLEIQPKSVKSIQTALLYAFEHYEEMGRYARNGTDLMKKVIAKDRLSHGRDLYNRITK